MAPAPSYPHLLPRADKTPTFGTGVKPANDLDNAGFLALFAIIGAAMVVAGIWFFFMARNGGFKWRQGDWEDYKSTVLRRKGPDGRTLSNATKSTRLGGTSQAPKFSDHGYTDSNVGTESEVSKVSKDSRGAYRDQYRHHRHTKGQDPELRAYKQEKAAKVGGMNTRSHGSQWDGTNTDRSEVSRQPESPNKREQRREQKERERREKEQRKAEAKDAEKRAKEEKRRSKSRPHDDATVVSSAPPSEVPQPRNSHPPRYEHEDDVDSHFSASNPIVPPPLAAYRVAPSSILTGGTGAPDHATIFTVPSEAQTHGSRRQASSYYDAYRPANDLAPVSEKTTPTSSAVGSDRQSPSKGTRQASQQKRQSRGGPRYYGEDSEASFQASTSATGTKVYTHHIPGLTKGEPGIDESVSQVGVRQERPSRSYGGFRRSGLRRNSLDDSEV
ncbi:hypothetical protein EJ06DRAFT_532440 [Trichodelitschia bisporula]|uniref:Uncharacterized protein n=1 Tax=Trichodelitschia bisporula TaxID=703511 RepID=A0A6G1HQC6_9PEZI|nr:hypothetical protein EJ06DRAFT_532440 [Trichodelitschia bisporula]